MPEQNCPLCGKKSKYSPLDFGRKKEFECSHCKVFIISKTNDELIKELSNQLRNKISLASSSLPDNLLLFIWHKDGEIIFEAQLKTKWI